MENQRLTDFTALNDTYDANLLVFSQTFSSELFCNKNKVFLPWWLGNDLNSEKAHEPMERRMGGKKGKDGNGCLVMAGAERR